jgi:hypothetical protein
MDQCTFGAGPLRGAREQRASQRRTKNPEGARLLSFLFAPMTVTLEKTIGKRPDPNQPNVPAGVAHMTFGMRPSL